MPKVSPIQNAFNAGELSPLLYGRTDVAKYKAGLETSLNGVPLVQGGWTRRPGTYFAAEVKTSAKATRLVPFEFSTTQAYILEFGDAYIRFYRNQGQIESSPGVAYEIVSPYAEAHLFELKFTQSADVLYIAHPSYAPRKLSRTGHTSWTISEIDFLDGPYINQNITATTITPSGTTGAITLTASANLFASTDVGRLVRIAHTPPAWVTATAYVKDAVVRSNGNVYICTSAGTSGAAPNGTGTAITDGTAVWSYAAGGSRLWGWVEITAFTNATLVDATVRGTLGGTTAVTDWRLGVWSGTTGYPGAVCFFEDRLFWGGATSYPQRIDGSKSSEYENYAPTNTAGVSASDNAVAFTLNASDVNVIRWLVDDEKGLLVGTVGGEWIVRPSSQNEALSPTNITAKQSTTHGSANVQPVRAAKSALYVQRSGRKVRELAYVFEVDGFRSPDLTIFSEHITAGGIKQIDYQQEPQSIIWCVRNDGVLLGMTYERDQDVVAWHRHIVGGSFGSGDAVVESIAVIPEPTGTYDELWMIVKRTINGSTKRYVEFMTKFFEEGDAIEDVFFVDCGLSYDGVPVTTITGLTHLEGQTVTVLADGATHPDRTVSAGAITLARSASVVHVGLHKQADGRLLRIDAGAADGTAQGKTQRIHHMGFRLHNTLGIKVGRDFDNLTAIPFRSSADAMDAPPALFSGDKMVEWEGDYEDGVRPAWRQDQPLPCTVLAVMPQLHTMDR